VRIDASTPQAPNNWNISQEDIGTSDAANDLARSDQTGRFMLGGDAVSPCRPNAPFKENKRHGFWFSPPFLEAEDFEAAHGQFSSMSVRRGYRRKARTAGLARSDLSVEARRPEAG
jgi:hypothetical protein